MTLPSSGPLSLSAIAAELGLPSNSSLRTLSAEAGFSAPDSISEFYGYSAEVIRPYILGSYNLATGGYWSIDKGATWTKFDQTGWVDPYYRMLWGGDSQPLHQTVSKDGKYIGLLQGSHAAGCTRVRLYRSDDHGRTWTYQDWTNVGGFGYVQFTDETGQKQYMMGWWGATANGKGYSVNYGVDFTLTSYTAQVTISPFSSMNGGNSYGGFVNGGLHRSQDAGATWTDNWQPWGGGHQTGMCDVTGQYIICTRGSTSGGIAQYSKDYGVTDIQLGSSNKAWFFMMNEDASFCMLLDATSANIHWSTNLMASWTVLPFGSYMSGAGNVRMRLYQGTDTFYMAGYNIADQTLYKMKKGDTVLTPVVDLGTLVGTAAGNYMYQFSMNKFGGKDFIFTTIDRNIYRIDDITNPTSATLIWDVVALGGTANDNSVFSGIF